MTYTISDKGIGLIKLYEEFKPTAMINRLDKYEVGYGTIIYPNGEYVKEGDECSKEEAESYLIYTVVNRLYPNVVKFIKNASLPTHKMDALMSLVYDIGLWKFEHSDLRKAVEREYRLDDIVQFWRDIKIPKDKVHYIEKSRREAEISMWTHGDPFEEWAN